ncbi:MAG: glycosyltransferase family 2 protein [Candidatus Moranbacteria bacterium]|nr:glycosyltransferase family 2 protein [Candidatus Moranbacteria bacterium]
MEGMGSSPKVFVIILNFDGRTRLVAALRSVFSLSYDNFEVVVVDNASKDGSIEEAKRLFPKAHFILNPDNVGFAAGMNVGIRFALSRGAAYLFLLNNDAVCHRSTLSRLVSVAVSGGSRSLLSPIIRKKDGKTWFSGGKIDFLRMRTVHVEQRKKHGKEPYRTGYLSGCALLLPKSAIERVGLLDEGYFLYYEDADYSVRAKRKGYRLLVVPEAEVVHEEQSVSNPEKTYWLVRSGVRFFVRHTPWYFRPWVWAYLRLRKVKNAIDVSRGKKEALPVSSAYADSRTA